MIRTIWLALFCLGGIAAIASVKFVSSALGTKVENPKVERASIGLNAKNEELVKADRLAVNVELASSETIRYPRQGRSGRCWHPSGCERERRKPPLARTHGFCSIGQFRRQSERKKNKNKRKIVSVRPLKARCSDGKPQAFLQSVNRSPQCGIASRLAGKRPIITR
jgi:hypothetical protein